MLGRKDFIFFVILAGILLGSVALYFDSSEERITGNKSDTPAINADSYLGDCVDIRSKRAEISSTVDQERKSTLDKIYSIQRKTLLIQLQVLFQQNVITKKEWKNVKLLSSYFNNSEIPPPPINDSYILGEKMFDRLLNGNHISRFFDSEVIELGENLANTKNPEFLWILKYKKCFDDLEVKAAESLLKVSSELGSQWGEEQPAGDFVEVLLYKKYYRSE